MVKLLPLSASQIIQALNGELAFQKAGTSSVLSQIFVSQLGEPLEVDAEGIAFIISESYLRDLEKSKARILVVQKKFLEQALSKKNDHLEVLISVSDAYIGLAQLSKMVSEKDQYADWRHSTWASTESKTTGAYVHSSAEVHSSVQISPGVVVCEGARLGARTLLLPNVVIGPEVSIGEDCVLFPGVVLYPRTQIGDRVRIHSNVVIGSDGFGYARGARGSEKIWHLGKVVIGSDVEIGSGTTIDRGTMKDTIIEQGAKLDNLVQIGHNGHVRAHAILCAQVGMAGNVTVGRGAILAGKVGIADKVEIGDGALVGPMSGISKDVKPGDQVMGQIPARQRREWWKVVALIDRLPSLFERVKKIEQMSSDVDRSTQIKSGAIDGKKLD